MDKEKSTQPTPLVINPGDKVIIPPINACCGLKDGAPIRIMPNYRLVINRFTGSASKDEAAAMGDRWNFVRFDRPVLLPYIRVFIKGYGTGAFPISLPKGEIVELGNYNIFKLLANEVFTTGMDLNALFQPPGEYVNPAVDYVNAGGTSHWSWEIFYFEKQ